MKGREVYTVTGSQPVTAGIDVQMTGARSGVVKNGHIPTGRKVLNTIITGDIYFKQYDDVIQLDQYPVPGDSGGPVYTAPDENGNVRIVGIVSSTYLGDLNGNVFISSWDDIQKALDLKPID